MDIAPHRLAAGSPQLELAKLVIHLARARIPRKFESAGVLKRDRLGLGGVAMKPPQVEVPAAGPSLDKVRLRVWIRLLVIRRHQNPERGRGVDERRLHGHPVNAGARWVSSTRLSLTRCLPDHFAPGSCAKPSPRRGRTSPSPPSSASLPIAACRKPFVPTMAPLSPVLMPSSICQNSPSGGCAWALRLSA